MSYDFSGLRPDNFLKERSIPQKDKYNPNDVILLELESLKTNMENPFSAMSDDDMKDLVDSIESIGLINPIVVRPIKDTSHFEILTGHNRVSAYKILEKDKIESIIKDIDDSSAALMIIDSNLKQRSKIKPSERSKAYRIQISVFNKEKWNEELVSILFDIENSSLVEEKDTISKISKIYGESRANIYRYLRLSYLIEELLILVDNKKLSIDMGAKISYLTKETQTLLKEYFFSDAQENILTESFVNELRSLEKIEEVTREVFEELINKRKRKHYFSKVDISVKKLKKEVGVEFASKEQAEIFIIKAVKFYKENFLDSGNELYEVD